MPQSGYGKIRIFDDFIGPEPSVFPRRTGQCGIQRRAAERAGDVVEADEGIAGQGNGRDSLPGFVVLARIREPRHRPAGQNYCHEVHQERLP